MKSYLLKILLFFSVVFVVDQLFGTTVQYLHDHMHEDAEGGTVWKNWYACRKSDENCLIFGSSRARYAYVPEVFEEKLGMSCRNVGASGMGIIYNYGLLKLITERYTPELIIYDVYSFDTFDDDRTRFLDPLKPYYDEPGIDSLFWAVDPSYRIKMHSGLCRFNTSFFGILYSYFKRGGPVSDGYTPLYEVLDPDPAPPIMNDTEPAVDSLRLQCFEDFIRLTREKGIRLICCVSPCYRPAGTGHLFAPIEDLCREYGVPFLDPDYPDFYGHREFFKDEAHLNDSGARRYSAQLAEEILSEP